jgi:hypothetical protein
MGRDETMARPRGPTSTTDRIDWREARYLARVVQLLVTSPADKAEFKRELDYLVSAAEALRTGVPPPHQPGFDHTGQADLHDRTDGEAEGAVLALWRGNSSVVRDEAEEAHDEAIGIDMLLVSRGEPDPVDEAELAQAVEEIERAAAALRMDESASTAPVEGDAGPHRRPLRVWLQIAGLWISIAAATAAMVAGLILIMR